MFLCVSLYISLLYFLNSSMILLPVLSNPWNPHSKKLEKSNSKMNEVVFVWFLDGFPVMFRWLKHSNSSSGFSLEFIVTLIFKVSLFIYSKKIPSFANIVLDSHLLFQH